MKFVRTLLLSLLLLTFFSTVSFAGDSATIRRENGRTCIDLKSAYEEMNNTSKATVGQMQTPDSMKKSEMLATLSNILSLFVGNKIYCVNDEVAAAKTNSFKDNGLLGLVENTNNRMLASFPSISVGEHLAKEFVPGYKGNNSILAESLNFSQDPEDHIPGEEKKQKNIGLFEKTVLPGMEEWAGTDKIEESVKKDLEEERNAPELDASGYTFLKDSLRLDLLWSASRDIAYIFFVIVMIIIGFMIMFRKNLDGQTIVSLGNTIPRVIVCLLLVTFSFAIAGIMLDLGRASMGVVQNIFVHAQEKAGDSTPAVMTIKGIGRLNDQLMYAFNPFDMVTGWIKGIPVVGNSIAKIYNFIPSLWEKSSGAGTSLAYTGVAGGLFAIFRSLKSAINTELLPETEVEIDFQLASGSIDPTNLGEAALDATMTFPQTAILIILLIILAFIVICMYASVKLFITIITTYFKLFINVVVAPLQIAVGAIPGNFSSVTNWFKSLAANILVFVVIIAILHIFNFFGNNIDPAKFNFFGNKGVIFPSSLIRGVCMFAGYLFASNAPAMVNGFLGVGENKTMAAVGQSTMKAASKIPLVGKMFNN